MQTLSLGNITFEADDAGLVVDVGPATGRLSLSLRDAGVLEEFLRRHLPHERRVGFRVPLAPLAEPVRDAFHIELHHGTEAYVVTPVDLSLTGVLVEAPPMALRPGLELRIELRFEGLSCRLTGAVVRVEGNLLALHFIESLKDGELAPPEALLATYRKLETEWLRSRVH